MESFLPYCDAEEIRAILQSFCEGKSNCKLQAPREFVLSKDCQNSLPKNIVPTLFVHAHCSSAPSKFTFKRDTLN
jgi:hypothetical protein